MSRITIVRTQSEMPSAEPRLAAVRSFLFDCIDGFTRDDKRSWRRLWKKIKEMEPGEMLDVDFVFPRSGPFHRRHMALEQRIFDAQDRFPFFKPFRDWLKIGAGHCQWVPGPRGAVVPIPDSTSYSAMDDEKFRTFHNDTVAFFRSAHAQKVLWPHLDVSARAEMMESILEEFEE